MKKTGLLITSDGFVPGCSRSHGRYLCPSNCGVSFKSLAIPKPAMESFSAVANVVFRNLLRAGSLHRYRPRIVSLSSRLLFS